MIKENEVYISTGGFNLPGYQFLEKYKNKKIYIELSGGKFHKKNDTKIIKLRKKKLKYRLHNYFPPPKNPFVLNLASSNNKVLNLSLEHICKAIKLTSRIGAKYYSFHAGFLVDPMVDRLGKKFDLTKIQNRKKCLSNFRKNLLKVDAYAKSQNVKILIENNVVTKKNLNVFGQNPFLLTNPKEILYFFSKLPKRIGLLVDVGHLNVSAKTENFDRVKALKKIGKFIRGYHLSENNGISDSNKKINKNSWFLDHLKNDLDYYTIEVYDKPFSFLNKQAELVKNILNK